MIVTSDGRVLVDLGYGYEQVARTCPYAYGYGCQSYGYPIAPQTPVFQNINPPPQYIPPRYAPPAYGAPYYPTPTYPSGGYGGYPGGGQYYYPPTYQPPTAATGCPPGYVPTGSYPPCVDPSLTPATSAALPGAVQAAAPRRPPAATVLMPRVRR